jgi:hypothetical protein
MFKKTALLFLITMNVLAAAAQTIQTPEQFLGYRLGEQFTPHHRIVDYFRYVAQVSKNVKLQQYGTTNEGRPLMAMFIASEDNIGRLEEIRQNNIKLTGLDAGGTPVAASGKNQPVICWLSFNVHGNEPASSEAAMQVLFDMVDPANTESKSWLKNTLVVIDPCLNPDGRERYINFYNSVKGAVPDAIIISTLTAIGPGKRRRNRRNAWPYLTSGCLKSMWTTTNRVIMRLTILHLLPNPSIE